MISYDLSNRETETKATLTVDMLNILMKDHYKNLFTNILTDMPSVRYLAHLSHNNNELTESIANYIANNKDNLTSVLNTWHLLMTEADLSVAARLLQTCQPRALILGDMYLPTDMTNEVATQLTSLLGAVTRHYTVRLTLINNKIYSCHEALLQLRDAR